MMKTLLYFSTIQPHEFDVSQALHDIENYSATRNLTLGITGALVASSFHFVQKIEGPATAVNGLLNSIRRDTRHADLRIVTEKHIATREFATWNMKNLGRARYLDKHIAHLVHLYDAGVASTLAVQLDRLMVEFGRLADGQRP